MASCLIYKKLCSENKTPGGEDWESDVRELAGAATTEWDPGFKPLPGCHEA